MKKYLLSIVFLIPVFFLGCETIVYPPSPDFYATEYSSTNTMISISFTDQSSNNPNEWYWTFEGGIPSTSTERNPTVTYLNPGTFDVSLWVKNSDGVNEIAYYDYINVVELYNPLFTDMDITVDGLTKTVSPDSYALFSSIFYSYVDYYAETFGQTSEGTVIGEEIFWDERLNLLDYYAYDLTLGPDFIFLYINNSSNYDYYPIYVNWNTNYETEDNVIIPNDNMTYQLGYYFAFNNMEIRAYLENSLTLYDSWNVFPSGTENQYTELVYKKSAQGNSTRVRSEKVIKNELLNPKSQMKNKIERDSKAKKLFPSNER